MDLILRLLESGQYADIKAPILDPDKVLGQTVKPHGYYHPSTTTASYFGLLVFLVLGLGVVFIFPFLVVGLGIVSRSCTLQADGSWFSHHCLCKLCPQGAP